jgi:hypothetical protein
LFNDVAAAGVTVSASELRKGVVDTRPGVKVSSVTDALGSLLRASHLMAPDELSTIVAGHAGLRGVQEM